MRGMTAQKNVKGQVKITTYFQGQNRFLVGNCCSGSQEILNLLCNLMVASVVTMDVFPSHLITNHTSRALEFI